MKIRRLIRRRTKKAGLSPGTLIHVGETRSAPVTVDVVTYDASEVVELKNIQPDRLPSPAEKAITWVRIDGIENVEVIEAIGQKYNLHPLLLEDILNSEQRPKIEDFGDYLFIVMKMISWNQSKGQHSSDQVAIILAESLVISIHENENAFFNPIRERILNGKGRIRSMGSDYLAYALMDAIVDNYFTVFDKLGESIEQLEEHLVTNPHTSALQTINYLKREVIFLRRSIWPLREIVTVMERRESPLIRQGTIVYLRDLYDHTIQIIDSIEMIRDILTGMLDIYISSIGNKTNQVIKVLTIIATIFIPLTFLVGVYGMNFEYMPELAWRWGYPLIWTLVIGIGGGMLYYFRRRKWL